MKNTQIITHNGIGLGPNETYVIVIWSLLRTFVGDQNNLHQFSFCYSQGYYYIDMAYNESKGKHIRSK